MFVAGLVVLLRGSDHRLVMPNYQAGDGQRKREFEYNAHWFSVFVVGVRFE